MNIPIFRAKKIDSDDYVVGHFYQPTHFISDGGIIIDELSYDSFKVDITTLAIHFPDMLDSQGNKIFASLSEDGKGGDILSHCHKKGQKTTLKYLKDRFCFGGYTDMVTILQNNKVIGIQQ